MDTYKGKHPYITHEILRGLTNEHCHFEEITSVENYGEFFGCVTFRIQSYSFAAGALYDPITTDLIIKDCLQWSLTPDRAPHAKVCWHETDEDGPAGFYLANLNERDCPDWHLGGAWPEFDALFDEESENDFISRNFEMGMDGIIAALQQLGFKHFEQVQER